MLLALNILMGLLLLSAIVGTTMLQRNRKYYNAKQYMRSCAAAVLVVGVAIGLLSEDSLSMKAWFAALLVVMAVFSATDRFLRNRKS